MFTVIWSINVNDPIKMDIVNGLISENVHICKSKEINKL